MYDAEVIGDVYADGNLVRGGSLLLKNGHVAAILAEPSQGLAAQFHDYAGQLVLPGGIDAHAHAFSNGPEPEGIGRLTRGAAKGGITTVLEMPYDRGGPIVTADRFREKAALVESEAHVDVALYATIAKHDGWKNTEELIREGAVAIKVSTYENDPARFPEIAERDFERLFRYSNDLDFVVTVHAENANLIDSVTREMRAAGHKDALSHCASRPIASESTAVARLVELARLNSGRLHIAHLTTPFGYELLRFFRDQGTDVTAEACLHYLLISDQDLEALGGFAKVHPPIRSAEAQDKLWEELFSGGISFVTSDHVPWTRDQKNADDFFDIPPGLPSIEVLAPLLYSEAVVKRGLSLQRFVEVISENPAKRYGLFPRKGRIGIGSEADLMILDQDHAWTFDASKQESLADWSPYDGRLIHGEVSASFVRGNLVYERSTGLSAARIGKFRTRDEAQ